MKAIFLLAFLLRESLCFQSLLVSSTNRQALRRTTRNTDEDTPSDEIDITDLTITSKIQYRYSRTYVDCKMKNPGTQTKETSFSLVLPDSAFISNLTMVVDDVEYVAEVKPKKEAKIDFSNSRRNTGLVEKEISEANVFSIQANIEPAAKVSFRLTYDEQLTRKFGSYEHVIHVNPGQIVKNMSIFVDIDESLPVFNNISVTGLQNSNDITKNQASVDSSLIRIENDYNGNTNRSKISINIPTSFQKEYGKKGIQDAIHVKYDVDRGNQVNEVQVIDGYFVHFFTPENLKTLPKHIIFVLDTSGSMDGRKMQQLKDAMFSVLDEMTDSDHFSIITFSTSASTWRDSQTDETQAPVFKASKENKKAGIDFIFNLEAFGNTNIGQSIQDALQLAKKIKIKEVLSDKVQTMILFMTDGQPTQGVTEPNQILEDLILANSELKIPIFSLGFGADADFELIKKMSSQTNSHAKQVFEGSDAALQLEGFYKEISSPLITNLKFKYVGNSVKNESLTNTEVNTLFKGGEFIIAGEISPDPSPPFIALMEGKAGDEIFNLTVCSADTNAVANNSLSSCHVNRVQPKSEAQLHIRNLYAFLNIKQLLANGTEANRQKAKQIALERNFVTDLTSLLLTQDNQVRESEIRRAKTKEYDSGWSSSSSRMQNSPYSSSRRSSRRSSSSTTLMQHSPYSRSRSSRRRQRPTFSRRYSRYSSSGTSLSNPWPSSASAGWKTPFSSAQDSSSSSSLGWLDSPSSGSKTQDSWWTSSNSADSHSSGSKTQDSWRTSSNSADSHSSGSKTQDSPISSLANSHSSSSASQDSASSGGSHISSQQNSSGKSCDCKLHLFSKTYLRGEEQMFTDSTADLGGFNDKAVSGRLEGSCSWYLYARPNQGGERIQVTPSMSPFRSPLTLKNLLRNVKSVQKVC